MSLTFITGNSKKVEQIQRYSNIPLLHKKLDLEEIQSLDPHKIITHKAKEAFAKIKQPVLVEDVSLIFCAMGRLPGTLIKWFLEEFDNEGLCRLMDHFTNRKAIACVTYGLCIGESVHIFDGTINGTISQNPRGDKLFGWSPIFIPEGYKETWAEMSRSEQDKTSMRKIALSKLEKYLKIHPKTI